MRRHGTLERSQHQHGRLGTRFEHVETHPVIFQHALMQHLHHRLHEFLSVGYCPGQLGKLVADLFDSAGRGHK